MQHRALAILWHEKTLALLAIATSLWSRQATIETRSLKKSKREIACDRIESGLRAQFEYLTSLIESECSHR